MAKSKKPLVIVTRKLPDAIELRMRELFDTRLNPDDKPMTQGQLAEAVRVADVLVPTVTDRIDASVLGKSGEQLKLIANFGNGVDNIDVASAVQRGITVTNTPGVLTEDTADLAMGLIMATSRRLVEGANLVQAGGFAGWAPTWMLGRRLTGKRLGIIGMGRIGQALARRGTARISAIVMSAVSSVRTPGVLVTVMPRAIAALTSILSTPLPKLAMSFSWSPA